MSTTTMRVTPRNRDELARIAAERGITLDEALAVLLFEHRLLAQVEVLESDPEALADYRSEAGVLAEVDVAVKG